MKNQTAQNRRTQESEVALEWNVGDTILNTYQVEEVFTGGGMALVYRVFHKGWGIRLAVKSPRPETFASPESEESFIREAETWVNLDLHPHIISCYYVRRLGGIPRIFMEYASRGSLQEAIEQGWLYRGAPAEVLKNILDFSIQFGWGLHYSHEKGLVHQDVKPANVLISADGLAKVTDFGIAQARASSRPGGAGPVDLEANQGARSILVDTVGLTPAYCSPEQADARPVSRRTDIWSWAVTVMEMFTGRKTWKTGPAAKEGLREYLSSGATHSVIPPMPPAVAGLLERCFAEKPEDRPRDMRLVCNELIEIYQRVSGQAYPRAEPKMDTALADTLNNRAVSMADIGREADALQYFDAAARVDSDHPALIYNRSLYLWSLGKITDQDALRALVEVTKKLPNSAEPACYSASLHLERGDYAAALSTARAAVARFGEQERLKAIIDVASQYRLVEGGALKTLDGSRGAVNSVAISAAGDRFISAGNDSVVKVWNLASAACVRELTGHTDLIRTIRMDSSGTRALSASWDTTLRWWDLTSGSCLEEMAGHEDVIQDADITPDGRLAVSASADATLRVWDLQTGSCLQVLRGHRDTVWSVALLNGGARAVSSSLDNTLRVWDLASGECLKSIDWPRSCTSNLSPTAEGRSVFFAGGDQRLWLVDLETGAPIRSFSGHTGGASSVLAAGDNPWLFSGGIDGTIRMWDLHTGQCLRTFNGHRTSVNSLSFCPKEIHLQGADGKPFSCWLLASGSSDRSARVWMVTQGIPPAYVIIQPRSSTEVQELSAQMKAELAAVDGYLARGDEKRAHQALVRLRQNPDSQRDPRLLSSWDRIGRRAVRAGLSGGWMEQSFRAHSARINAIALAPDANQALTASDDKTLALWDLTDGLCVHQYIGHLDGVNSVDISPDEQLAISGSSDGSLAVWRLRSGECLAALTGHTSEVNSVSFSSDGRLALSTSNDHTIRVWSVGQRRCLRVLNGHTHYVRSAFFHPDQARVISASWDKTLRLWNLSTGECLSELSGHSEVIDALAVSPDGRFAASGGMDHTLRIWDLNRGQAVRVIEGISRRIENIVYSPDGAFLFAGEDDGSIHVWQVLDGREVMAVKGYSQPVTALEITRDGTRLVSGGSDRTLKVWKLDWEYEIPEGSLEDESFHCYLGYFLARHRPLDEEQLTRSGKAAWTAEDLVGLFHALEARGYGNVPHDEVMTILRALAR